MKHTKITAHRGYSKNQVENTIPAFKEALRIGCERLEFDLHYSKDSQLVIHHDYCISTKAGLIKPIIELNYAEMLGDIPLLEDVFNIIPDEVDLEVELKGSSLEFVNAVLLKIEDSVLLKRMEITSPHPYVLSYLKKKRKDIKLGMFVSPFPTWMPEDLGRKMVLDSLVLAEIDVAHCPLGVITQEFIFNLNQAGKLVHAANCNSQTDLEKAFLLGVDQLSTDELELVISVRDSLGL